MNQTLIDISPPITSDTKVWPGDNPPERDVLLDLANDDNLTLSTLRTSVHMGAHVDAPSHYDLHGRTIDEQPLDLYVGPCEVMHIRNAQGRRIGIEDLPARPAESRLLLRTDTFPDPEIWNEDFAALEPDLVDHLHDCGVRLVGIDTPSVDLFQDRDLLAHDRFRAMNMAILEGIRLQNVDSGRYELIALPLKLAGFDASPVRAILRTLNS